MPLIGDTTRFATQYELSTSHTDAWMFGHFCYWCDGVQIGDFSLQTSLRDVLFQIEEKTKWVRERFSSRLFQLDPGEAFRLLDEALFGDPSAAVMQTAEDEQWAKHNVSLEVDALDSWKIFLIDHHDVSRILFSREPYTRINCHDLGLGDVDRALDGTRAALLEIYDKVRGQ